jgi:tellurite resistance protein
MPFDIRSAFSGISFGGDSEQPRLVAELALWSAMYDGDLAEEEIDAISASLSQIPDLADFTVDDAKAMVSEMLKTFDDDEKVSERITDVAASITDPALRRVAYQLAIYCAATDGGFSPEESEFLRGLQAAFELNGDDAKHLIDEVLG